MEMRLAVMVGSNMGVCETSMETRLGLFITTPVLSMGVVSVGVTLVTVGWGAMSVKKVVFRLFGAALP
jgi:hypothetical protein